MKTFVLGKMVEDTVTKTKGMLTHMLLTMGGDVQYIYQPRGINPATGIPVDKIMIHSSRVKGGEEQETDVPMQILGTEAEDIATGYKGTIIGLVYHLDGCLHVEIKPAGILESGDTIGAQEFDIRRVKGKSIKSLSDKELKESIKKTPSPMSYTRKS